MDERIIKLINVFENYGWKLNGPVDVKKDWWFENIILLRSKWSPIGKELFLTLLTDPQDITERKIWCISISDEMPQEEDFHSIGQITLNDIKRTELSFFVKQVNLIALDHF